MAPSPSASSAPSSAPNVSTENPASSWMQATSSFSNASTASRAFFR
ncbi:hypothetical protein BN1708_018071 [Verticillium longisporum]|uniref:Uncharacterized protein n=1 Tax=Verticillium longisporum TaxID=100787 RepID=A0A0G4LPK2_VERLO|nr:hypothetical protein BN1708_018071 [Verticillium longisporum]